MSEKSIGEDIYAPDPQPKRITSILGAQKELMSIQILCQWLDTGPPDTYGTLADRLDPIIDFLADERRRRRKGAAR